MSIYWQGIRTGVAAVGEVDVSPRAWNECARGLGPAEASTSFQAWSPLSHGLEKCAQTRKIWSQTSQPS